MISKSLINAYLTTTYATSQKPLFNIRIGANHTDLDKYLHQLNAKSWAFITAENPYSNLLSNVDNRKNNKQLESDLEHMNIVYFKGKGIPDDSLWQPENSFLCIGLDRKDAKDLGIKYKQNAIVFGLIHQKAELVLLQ